MSVGIGLPLLRLLLAEAERLRQKEGPLRTDRSWEAPNFSRRKKGEPLTTDDFAREFVKLRTKKARRSYAELLRRPEAAAAARLLGSASDVGPADVFVSHAWKYLFADLVAAIEAFAAEHNRAEAFFWVDNLVVNQVRLSAPLLPLATQLAR